MATIQRLKTIFGWFEKGKYPTQEQFQNTFFSFWHKHDEIPTSAIGDLDGLLNSKYDAKSGEILEQRMAGAEERLDHHDSDIAGLHNEMDKQSDRLDEQDVRLDKHEEWLLEHDDELEKQTAWQEKQDEHLTAHDTQFKQVADQFTEHTGELAKHQAELDIHTGRLHGIDVELIDHENRLETHQQDLKDHKEILDNHEERITAAESRIEDHEERVVDAEGRIEDHETRITTNEKEIKDLHAKDTAQDKVLQDHEARIKVNEEDIEDLNSDIEKIKSGEIIAGSAKKLQTTRKIWGQNFNGEADVTGPLTGATTITATGTVTAPTFAGTLSGNASSATKLQTARKIGLTGVTATAQDFDGQQDININVSAVPGSLLTGSTTIPTSGNAGSATKLQTARTIWGQSFNGEANVSGNINNAGTISATGNIVTTAGNFFGYNMLEFNRGDACYIHNSHASGYLGLVAAGKVANAANSSMLVTGTTIYPGTTNVISLGTTGNRWTNVFTNQLNVSGATTLTGAVSTGSIINANDTITSNASNAFILNYGQYKAFLRTDEKGFYILVSDLNGNSFNSLRPFYINLATGDVNMARPVSISNTLSVTGTITAPTFAGALSGNATSATKLATARSIWGQSFDGTANVTGALTGVTTLNATGNITAPTFVGALSGNATSATTATTATSATKLTTARSLWGQSFNGEANVTGALTGVTTLNATGNITAPTFVGALSGNATSATTATSANKLVTARTLWGQSFDGTANVTGALTGVTTLNASGNITAPTFVGALSGNATSATTATTATSATKLTNARNIWGVSFDGTGNVTGALTGVTNLTATGTITAQTFSGNLSGNATTATTATTANKTTGTLTFTGGATGTYNGASNVSIAIPQSSGNEDLYYFSSTGTSTNLPLKSDSKPYSYYLIYVTGSNDPTFTLPTTPANGTKIIIRTDYRSRICYIRPGGSNTLQHKGTISQEGLNGGATKMFVFRATTWYMSEW